MYYTTFIIGIFLVPFCVFIYIIVSLSTINGRCQKGYKSWLTTECVIFACLIPDFFEKFYRNWKNKQTPTKVDHMEVED
jgi:hypothetical protein